MSDVDLVVHGTAALAEDDVRQLVEAVIGHAQLGDGRVDVGVHFVDAARIRSLNSEHRGTDATTDVLSFPVDGSDDVQGLDRQLGDVFVCASYVELQLREGTQIDPGDSSPRQALARCVVHGMLHLLGHRHDSEAETRAMQELEELLVHQALQEEANSG